MALSRFLRTGLLAKGRLQLKTSSAKRRKCRRCEKQFLPENDDRICYDCKQECSKCGVRLTGENQYFSNQSFRKSYICKECVSSTVRKTRNKSKQRDYDLKRNYGITEIDYVLLLNKQNDCCDICGIHKNIYGKRFAVDHDHQTGIVRGLLCSNCNTGIGKLKDNTDIIRKALKYMEKHKHENIVSEK